MSATRSYTASVQSVLDALVLGDFSGYDGMDRKERIQVRKAVTSEKDAAVRSGDLPTGMTWLSVEDALSERSKTSDKPELSPAEQIGQRVANLLEAARRLATGTTAPEGTDPVNLGISDIVLVWDDEVESDNRLIPDFKPESVERLTNVRIGRKSKQNDIPPLIRAAFADAPIGTFMKISTIRRHIAQMYPLLGVDHTWDGRLSAALFGKSGVNGVEGINKEHPDYPDFSRNGGRKVESDVWENPDLSDDEDGSEEPDEADEADES
jgi:hypothetical protein